MEDYRSTWWLTTVGSWILTTSLALGILRWGSVPRGVGASTYFAALDVVHHVGLASPLLAWALARRPLRRALAPAPHSRWLLTCVAPFWCIGIILLSLFMTTLTAAIGSRLYYGWSLLVPLFLLARLGLEVSWFWLSFRDAPRIAWLEQDADPGSGRAFRLQPLDGAVQRVAVKECDDFASTVYLVQGDSEVVWRAVGSIEDLAVAVRTQTPGRAGMEKKT